MMNWLYEAAPAYPQVEGFRDVGLQQIVCPGTSSWNTLFARLANARGHIRNVVAAGRRVAALGVLTTDWGDDGHPNLPASSWYGYAYTALEGWSPSQLDVDEHVPAEFERRFAHLFFGREEAGAALEDGQRLAAAANGVEYLDAILEPGLQAGNVDLVGRARDVQSGYGNGLQDGRKVVFAIERR